jgi:predicted small lipoprotein YifL
MNRKNFLLVPLLATLAACGQSGELYLPDDVKAEQLELQARQASTEASAARLRSEANSLRQRHQRAQSLRQQLAEQEARVEQLRGAGSSAEADEALKEVNRIRYDLGQLILQQQQSR